MKEDQHVEWKEWWHQKYMRWNCGFANAGPRPGVPDGWRGVLAKEPTVKRLTYKAVPDTALVERLFAVVKAQAEY
jgi:hypothetical protein